MNNSEPTETIRVYLRDNWDPSQTSTSETPQIFSGDWTRDNSFPCVVLHNEDEGPVQGGETGYTDIHGPTGKGMQKLSGEVFIDCIAGSDGSVGQLKKLRWSMYNHATQLLVDTVRLPGLKTVAPVGGRNLVDGGEEGDDPIFFRQFRARYTRDRKPNP